MRLDLVVFREPPFLDLGEDEVAVDAEFKPPLVGGDEGEGFDVLFERFQNRVRHTDGLGFIASSRAIDEFEFHLSILLLKQSLWFSTGNTDGF